jgi:hypothetical protein
VVDLAVLTGVSLGEGPARIDEGVVFRVSSRGINVTGVAGTRDGCVARCLGSLPMHLSLSLSLFASPANL